MLSSVLSTDYAAGCHVTTSFRSCLMWLGNLQRAECKDPSQLQCKLVLGPTSGPRPREIGKCMDTFLLCFGHMRCANLNRCIGFTNPISLASSIGRTAGRRRVTTMTMKTQSLHFKMQLLLLLWCLHIQPFPRVSCSVYYTIPGLLDKAKQYRNRTCILIS